MKCYYMRVFIEVGSSSAFKRMLHNALATVIPSYLSSYLEYNNKEDDENAFWCSRRFG